MHPYRNDIGLAAELGARASGQCQRQRGNAGLPPHPFTTDGCSASPDGRWKQCCIEHDIAYWCGGDAQARRHADEVFRRCVAEKTGNAPLACLMYGTLRLSGAPWLPFPWRWAYGWDGIRGYDAASTHPTAPPRGAEDAR